MFSGGYIVPLHKLFCKFFTALKLSCKFAWCNNFNIFSLFQASWPGSTRQMTLVPSLQQLANPANAAEANLLQPLFAAAASDADWRRPLIVDSSGGLRLQAEQAAAVFPAVVYERAAVAASASRPSSLTLIKVRCLPKRK